MADISSGISEIACIFAIYYMRWYGHVMVSNLLLCRSPEPGTDPGGYSL